MQKALVPLGIAALALFALGGSRKRNGGNSGSGSGGSGSGGFVPGIEVQGSGGKRSGDPCQTGVTGEYAQTGPDGECQVFWSPESNIAFAEAMQEVSQRRGLDPCEALDAAAARDVTFDSGNLQTLTAEVYVYPAELMRAIGETLSLMYDVPSDTFIRELPGSGVLIGADHHLARWAWGDETPYWTRVASKMAMAMTVEVVCNRVPVT